MTSFLTITNHDNEKRLFSFPFPPALVTYRDVRNAIVAEELAPPPLPGAFQFCVALAPEQEADAQIDVANGLIIFVKLNNQQPTISNNNNNNNNSATSNYSSTMQGAPSASAQRQSVTTGPVATFSGITVSQQAPTITGPTININMPQQFQQSAPPPMARVPEQVVQGLVKRVGLGSTIQPAVGRPGARVPSMFELRAEREAKFQEHMLQFLSDPANLLVDTS